jgi:drug/metabolite transporter (DMT)-like permease
MRARYLSLIAIWGGSFLFIKVGLEVLAPLQVVLGRMALGALALLATMVIRRVPLPREPRLWLHMAVAATLLNTVPYTLFAYAEQRIPSSVASICNATTPLFTLLVAMVALPDERPTVARGLGLVLGFLGVLVVFGVWSGGDARPDLVGVLLGLIASVLYGAGGVYLRRYLSTTRYSGLAISAGQMLIGALQLAIVTPLVTTAPPHLPGHVVLAILALGALGTGVAYVLQYTLIRTAGPTLTSTVTYCIPVVSIGLGVLVLGEHIAWNAPVGAAIIIVGAVLSRAVRRPAAAASPPLGSLGEPAAVAAVPVSRVTWVRGLA